MSERCGAVQDVLGEIFSRKRGDRSAVRVGDLRAARPVSRSALASLPLPRLARRVFLQAVSSLAAGRPELCLVQAETDSDAGIAAHAVETSAYAVISQVGGCWQR